MDLMAPRVNPSKGGKPDKLFRDALIIEVKRLAENEAGEKTQNINIIAAKVVKKAKDGDVAAVQIVRDSIDGKPMQAVEADISGDFTIKWES